MARTHRAMPLSMKRHHRSANLNFSFIAWEVRPVIPAVFFARERLRLAADRPAAATPADGRAFRFPESLGFPVFPAFPAFPVVTAGDGHWSHSNTRSDIRAAAIQILSI